jgi:hypothetical protein
MKKFFHLALFFLIAENVKKAGLSPPKLLVTRYLIPETRFQIPKT